MQTSKILGSKGKQSPSQSPFGGAPDSRVLGAERSPRRTPHGVSPKCPLAQPDSKFR